MESVDQEQWKDVSGYEGRYWVSDYGRVRSQKCTLRPGPQSKGYLCVQLYDGSSPKRPRSFCVHDLVAAAFIGPKSPGMQVNHKDTVKSNNNVSNLEYMTPLQNVRHARDNGLIRPYRGSAHSNSVLTNQNVIEIREYAMVRNVGGRRIRSLSDRALGRKYGCSPTTIASVIAGKSYK